METPDDEPQIHPLQQLFEAQRQEALRQQKIAERTRLENDRLLQKLRMELTAMVDDPTHPLTENDFMLAYKAYDTGFDAIKEAVMQSGSERVAAIVVRLLAEKASLTIKHMRETKCTCPNCAE